jgi:hypothetical protein
MIVWLIIAWILRKTVFSGPTWTATNRRKGGAGLLSFAIAPFVMIAIVLAGVLLSRLIPANSQSYTSTPYPTNTKTPDLAYNETPHTPTASSKYTPSLRITQTIAPIKPTQPPNNNLPGCAYGCTIHKDGCDIKGNISFTSKEKIYHIPGGKFYNATTIDPAYGERWFCTQAEALSNGWRRSAE